MAEPSFATCKIIIDGTWKSGKKTFVHTISEKDKTAEESKSTTVRFGFGRITSQDQTVALYLFALPRNRRDLWEQLMEGALGSILMIDSRHPEMFREARATFETHMVFTPLPIIIAANFQDLPDAWDVEALRIVLHLPDDIPIIPCVATDRESVKGVILALLNEVLKDIRPSRKSRKKPPHG